MRPTGTLYEVVYADRKSTRLNSSHSQITYAVFCLRRRPRRSPLFPYTTLFRSEGAILGVAHGQKHLHRLDGLGATLLGGGRQGAVLRCVLLDGVHHLVERPDEAHRDALRGGVRRSEEHTSELQSQSNHVCRLLLETATTSLSTLSLHDALPI